MDSERLMTWATTLMTQLSGAMASIVLLVMTVIFMLFEVRHLPTNCVLPSITRACHIAGLHRALKGVTHYLALKTLISLWTGLIVWLGLLAMGVQFALMWGVLAFFAELCAEHWLRHLRYPPMLQALLFSGIYECLLVGALFLVVHMVAGQHGGAAHDGPPAGDVDPGGVPVVVGLGLAAGAGGNAALGAVNQRL